MNKTLKTRAFTLIEVLVVTSIIALLASITNASLTEARKESEDKVKKQETNQVRNAIEIQRSKTGSVPAVSSGSYVAHNEKSSEYQDAMKELVDNGAMPEVPRSDSGKDYYYLVDDSGNGVFGAILESDSSIEESNGCYFTDPDIGCSGSNATYTIYYDREQLISEADSCESDCGGVEDHDPYTINIPAGGYESIKMEPYVDYTINFGNELSTASLGVDGITGGVEFGASVGGEISLITWTSSYDCNTETWQCTAQPPYGEGVINSSTNPPFTLISRYEN